MDEQQARLVWSDAWLLLAVLYAEAPAERMRIKEIGDIINHAVFTEEELEGGLRRLKAAGHVLENDGRFRASPAAAAWFESVRLQRTYMLKDLERVEGFLGISTSRKASKGRR